MRTLFSGMSVAAGLLVLASPAVAQHKVAYLDSQRIIREAPGAEQVRTQIQQEMQRFENQLKVMQDSLQKLENDYRQKSVVLSPEEKTKRENELRQKYAEMQQKAGQLEQQAAERQDALMKPVMDRVEKVISDIRQEEGYAIIFDVASRSMVSADTTLDLTTKVLTRLRADNSSPTASRNQ